MTLFKRIVAEHRTIILMLLVGLLLNIGAYALVVYPLQKRSAGAADRSAAATLALRAAERDLGAARALVAGKSRADEALTTFYDKVLPNDLASARRMTYTRIPDLARKTAIKYESRSFDVQKVQSDERLGRLAIRVALQGQYENIRQFLYELESSPEFIIIDDVSLSQGEADKPLNLAVQLSTYYRLGPNGA